MSDYDQLLDFTKQLDRRLAKLERQEVNGSSDDYPIYLLASGARTGATSQTQAFTNGIAGATTANGNLDINGTTHGTKATSTIVLQPSGGSVGIGRTPTSNRLEVSGYIYNTYPAINILTTETTLWAANSHTSSRFDLTTDASNVSLSFRVAKGNQRFTSSATTMAFLQYGTAVDQFEIVHGTTARLAINSSGLVGIGRTPTSSNFEVQGSAGLFFTNATNFSNGLSIFKRGATGDDTAAVASGAEIGYHSYYAWDGSAYGRGSFNLVKATEAWSSTAHGASYSIWTTPNGSTSYAQRLTVDHNGNVGIGTSSPGAALDLSTGAIKTVETSVTEAYFENTGLRMKNVYTGAGWTRALLTYENSGGTDYFSIGALGSGQTFTYAYIGPAYNTPWMTFRDNNVGINTTAPPLRLSILTGSNTNSYATQTIMLGDNRTDYYASIDSVRGSASTYMGLAFSTANNATPAEVVRIQWDGKVGISTTAPPLKLSILSGSVTNNYSTPLIMLGDNRVDGYYASIDSVRGSASTLMGLAFSTANNSAAAEVMRIQWDGKVGIGTTGPEEKLHVTGNVLTSNSSWYESENASGTNIRLLGMSGNDVYIGAIDNAGGAVYFRGGGATQMALVAGDFGIGTTSPGARLHVSGGQVLIDNGYYYYTKNSGGTSVALAGITGSDVYLGAVSNAGGKVFIREDGADVITLHGANVGIGQTSPTNGKLQVEGKVGIKTGVNAINAQLMVYQDSSTAAIAVLDLVQDDVSEEFINFRSAEGTGQPADTAALGSYAKKVRVAVNGTFYWLALYN